MPCSTEDWTTPLEDCEKEKQFYESAYKTLIPALCSSCQLLSAEEMRSIKMNHLRCESLDQWYAEHILSDYLFAKYNNDLASKSIALCEADRIGYQVDQRKGACGIYPKLTIDHTSDMT